MISDMDEENSLIALIPVLTQVTPDDFQSRLALLEIEESDLAIREQLVPFIKENVESIVQEFYDYVFRFPEMVRLIHESVLLEELKKTQVTALVELFEEPLDFKFAKKRMQVGLTHYRVGLVPKYYISAYSALMEILCRMVKEKKYMGLDEVKVLSVIVKILHLDMQLAIDSYNHQFSKKYQEKAQAAQEASRAKSEFLANMSHELRTPLNSIINFTDWVKEKVKAEGKEKYTDRLERVLKNADYLLTLISDILDLSKIEAGKFELQLEEVSLPLLFSEVGKSMEPLVIEQGNELVIEVSEGMEPVRTDKTRLNQILYNLLSNAAKFTSKGTITLKAVDDLNGVMISVQDTGIGIARTDLERIFEKFKQLETSKVKRYKGTGLGLAITQELVRLLKGKVTLESEINKGTRFSIWLPRVFEL